jgi:tRNA 5-methylaminomethyl-2-thiouridine biosynthesis bifunctional protein
MTAAASARNVQTLVARLPGLAGRVAGAGKPRSRAAIRATTPDRLPVAGELAPGLFALTGLGSRGFCVAPLLAEHVAALAVGAPSPLPRSLAARIGPGRFVAGGPPENPLPEADG